VGISVVSCNRMRQMQQQQQQCSIMLKWLDTSFCCRPECSSSRAWVGSMQHDQAAGSSV
jgi:hypothetical protein